MAFYLDWIIIVFLAASADAATTYTVGDTTGWTVPTNTSFYDNWVADKSFEPGDSLVFNWTSTHNVLEVTSKAEYDSCTKTNGILKETSPVTIPLTANGTLYFICTIGTHCTLGQKVTIKVGNGVSTSPPPSNSANPPFTISAFWPLLSAILMYFFASPAHIVY